MILRLLPIAALGLTTAADEPATPFADIPNVTLVTYDVVGRTAAAVRRSIDSARPLDPNDGKRVDGLSRWEYKFTWHSDERGTCSSTLEDIIFSATVTVPRLAGPDVPTKLLERFDRYRESLLAHEDGHIRYAWDHRGEVIAAINAATCDTAGAAAQAALQKISEHDVAYDMATRHGETTILPLAN